MSGRADYPGHISNLNHCLEHTNDCTPIVLFVLYMELR